MGETSKMGDLVSKGLHLENFVAVEQKPIVQGQVAHILPIGGVARAMLLTPVGDVR